MPNGMHDPRRKLALNFLCLFLFCSHHHSLNLPLHHPLSPSQLPLPLPLQARSQLSHRLQSSLRLQQRNQMEAATEKRSLSNRCQSRPRSNQPLLPLPSGNEDLM